MSTQISVLMSVHNGAPYLDQAVRSILEQSFEDFEFVIVDDGSTDGSEEMLDAFARMDARVRVLRQAQRGLIRSLNRAIRESRAPILARMDADDVSEPDRFERQLAFLSAHPECGLLGAQISIIGETGAPAVPHFSFPTSYEGFLAALEDRPLMSHPSAMMRREPIIEAGGYRPAFVFCEDYDLWLRLSERTRACSLSERLLRYRRHSGQVSSRHFLRQQINSAIAWAAHCERRAGRCDPTADLAALPAIETLDSLFGQPGLGAAVRARVASRLIYSPVSLKGDGYSLLLEHIRDGFPARGALWRTVARLLRLGLVGRAIRLAAALSTH